MSQCQGRNEGRLYSRMYAQGPMTDAFLKAAVTPRSARSSYGWLMTGGSLTRKRVVL